MPEIFVIIVTYKGKLWYDRCFSSLRNSEIPLHTVVIDNASNDGTVEYIRENFPEVHMIPSEKNLGFGQGNNLGIKYALANGADYVFLLNQDAWIEPNTLKELIQIHKRYPEFGILSPIHLNADKTSIEKGFLNYISNNKLTDSMFISDMYLGKLKSVYESIFINAAAWLLPSDTIFRVGGFDPIFFHYGEDDNYMHRVYYHGLKIGICPNVTVVHDKSVRVANNDFVEMCQSKLQDIIEDATNVLVEFNYSKMQSIYFWKMVKSFFIFDFRKAKLNYSFLKLIVNKKDIIIKSRKQNMREGTSWL